MESSTSAMILPFAAGNFWTRWYGFFRLDLGAAMSRLSMEGDLWLGAWQRVNAAMSRSTYNHKRDNAQVSKPAILLSFCAG
jgi:hypothetical protein